MISALQELTAHYKCGCKVRCEIYIAVYDKDDPQDVETMCNILDFEPCSRHRHVIINYLDPNAIFDDIMESINGSSYTEFAYTLLAETPTSVVVNWELTDFADLVKIEQE